MILTPTSARAILASRTARKMGDHLIDQARQDLRVANIAKALSRHDVWSLDDEHRAQLVDLIQGW